MSEAIAAAIGESYNIRPCETSDYDAVAAVIRATDRSWAGAGDELRHEDESIAAEYYVQRLVAESSGEGIVAASYSAHYVIMHDPRKFLMSIHVHPDAMRRGIGAALYNRSLMSLESFAPTALLAHVSEDDDHSVGFAKRRGFTEVMREWKSTLDLARFDLDNFADRLTTPERYDCKIMTYADLAGDPERDRKLYDLDMAASVDEPLPDPFTPMPFELYRRMELESPNLIPDAMFVLVFRGEYVGMSSLTRRPNDNDVDVGWTGIARKARRRGLAFSLKVHAVKYAIEHGYKRIHTSNNSLNRTMLSINECLGFEKSPAYAIMRKTLSDGEVDR